MRVVGMSFLFPKSLSFRKIYTDEMMLYLGFAAKERKGERPWIACG